MPGSAGKAGWTGAGGGGERRRPGVSQPRQPPAAYRRARRVSPTLAAPRRQGAGMDPVVRPTPRTPCTPAPGAADTCPSTWAHRCLPCIGLKVPLLGVASPGNAGSGPAVAVPGAGSLTATLSGETGKPQGLGASRARVHWVPSHSCLAPPGPRGHRLLWANKPRAEAQLVTGVSCLPQPWGRNTVSQGQAPAWAGWAGTPAGPPLQAGAQQAPVTRVLEFSARRGARCSQIPSSSCARSRRLTAADSRHWQGELGGDPWPRASVGGQWGPPGAWGPPSSSAPH